MPARFKPGGVIGGGNVPAGAAVMTDSYSLAATVQLSDTNAALADAWLATIAAAYGDNLAAAADAILARLPFADSIAGQTDTYKPTIKAAETNAAQTEAILARLLGLADTNAALLETILARLRGYVDTNPAQSDVSTRTVKTWANANTTSGTAPTNPTNAQGENNGTVAQVKAGGLANGTSTLNLTIPVASVASGTRTFYAWYQTNSGTTDSFTMSVSNPSGNPASFSLPEGNFLTTPHQVALTTVGTSYTVTFTHSATTPATGGNIQIDAVAIFSTGSF